MTPRISDSVSAWLGNTVPPRDPDDNNDDDEEEEDDEQDEDREPAVIREPDEDEWGGR